MIKAQYQKLKALEYLQKMNGIASSASNLPATSGNGSNSKLTGKSPRNNNNMNNIKTLTNFDEIMQQQQVIDYENSDIYQQLNKEFE